MPKLCVEKSQILQTLNVHSSDITTCDFDNTFRFASGSSDKKVVISEWKPGAGYTQVSYSPITEYKYGVSKVKFIPEDQELITSSWDGCISIFNIEDGELLHILMHVNLASVRTFCYIHENKHLLSAGGDGTLCVWDLTRKTLKKSMQLHDETISVACVSCDSKIFLSGDTTGFVKVWHVSSFCDSEVTSELLPDHTIPDCHDLGINQADFSPITDVTDRGKEYRVITGGNDNLLKLWKLICRKREEDLRYCISELLFTIVGHGSAVTDVKFNFLGNMVASTSLDKTIRLWAIDEYNYQCLTVLKGHKRYVTTCSFSSDGTLLATGSNDRSVIIWDLTGERTPSSYLGKVPSSSSQPASPFKVKNVSTIMQKIENLGNAINSCTFSKDDLLAAGGTDKLVRLWHRNGNRFVEVSVSPLEGHQYTVNQVDFSVCGMYLVSCSVDGTAVVWNLSEYKQIGTVHSVEGGIKCCKFSPNSQLLATAGDHEMVCVWSLHDLQLIVNMTGHMDAVSCLSFTRDSRYLASGCLGGSIRLWCVSPCMTICIMCEENVHDLGITSMDFGLTDHMSSSKGEKYMLATCGNDSLVKLWLVHVINELTAKINLNFSLVGHGGDVTCVRFPPNSSSIVASTATDKTARIWNSSSGECLHVLDSKESMLTSCAFSFDNSLLATGTLDKSIIIWDLRRNVDEFEELATNRLTKHLAANGVIEHIHNEVSDFLCQLNACDFNSINVPHEFICPITQQLMVQPVVCADGYTYERSAIDSWFSSGKVTSPMTNEPINITKLTPNAELQNKITQFVKDLKKASTTIESAEPTNILS